MKISLSLKLNTLVVLVLFALNVITASYLVQRMKGNIRQLLEVVEPLERAILEMEINSLESARGVLDYLHNGDMRYLALIEDSERDFEQHAQEFDRLAETDEERALGRKISHRYREIMKLGDEIMSLASHRRKILEQFREDVLKIDEFIDESLQTAFDRSAADALLKHDAVLEMEINIHEAFATIEGFVLSPSPRLEQKFSDSQSDFEHFESQYRKTHLSPREKDLLDQIDERFRHAVVVGEEIVSLTIELNGNLEVFEEGIDDIDDILDDEAQSVVREKTLQAGRSSEVWGQIAIAVIVVAGLLVFAVVASLGRFVSKGIIDGVDQLANGAAEFGRGNLGFRIKKLDENELGWLAGVFNEMAASQSMAEQNVLKAQEQLVRHTRLATIGQMTASVAHEIRNPLGAVRNAAYYLKRHVPKDNPKLVQYLGIIDEEVAAADNVIRCMLEMARSKEPVKRSFDMSLTVRELFERKGSENSVRYELQSDSCPFMIEADEGQIRQVVDNLLVNAAQAIDGDGEIMVELREAGDYHEIIVCDSGPGFDVAHRDRIFEPLYTTKAKGTGLGLSICRQIVEHHGGTIQLQEHEFPGARISIRLPAFTVSRA